MGTSSSSGHIEIFNPKRMYMNILRPVMEEVLSEEMVKTMKWVGIFQVGIFWVGIFRREFSRGEFDGWEFSGWGNFPRTIKYAS